MRAGAQRSGGGGAATAPLGVLVALARLLPGTLPAAALLTRVLPRAARLPVALALAFCAAALVAWCVVARSPRHARSASASASAALDIALVVAPALALGAHHVAALSRPGDPARHLLAAALLAPAGAAEAARGRMRRGRTTTTRTRSGQVFVDVADMAGGITAVAAAVVLPPPLVACACGLVWAASRRAAPRGVYGYATTHECVAVLCGTVAAGAAIAGACRWPSGVRSRMVRPDTDALAVAGLPFVAALLGDRYETRALAGFSCAALVAVAADARWRYARVDALI